jgi:hypothetical protein
MSQPLPPSPYTHCCAVCYTQNQRIRPATWISDYTGHAVCDQHREHAETHGPAALRAPHVTD